ncbi:unnamed protein product [Phaedon cochleariae]|uniref:CCHC-type domain-containing protein n=1 Tax=Phaedon cochleariae TaxID=80249 RepID=A0A9N9X0L2_PHACE|nr:unnamed protein product [Phaedon cochleariae]
MRTTPGGVGVGWQVSRNFYPVKRVEVFRNGNLIERGTGGGIDSTPFVKRSYPVPFSYKEEVRKQIDEMVDWGIMEKCTDYVSPLVTVIKEDKSVRICLDARYLNAKMANDHVTPPLPDELLAHFKKTVTYISRPDDNRLNKQKLSADTATQFVLGLLNPIRKRVLSAKLLTLEDAVRVAKNEGTMKNLNKIQEKECRAMEVRNNRQQSSTPGTSKCYRCQKPGHFADDCKERTNYVLEDHTTEVDLYKRVREPHELISVLVTTMEHTIKMEHLLNLVRLMPMDGGKVILIGRIIKNIVDEQD